ncbi:MAG: hypothetical protein WDM90_19235 [Ferruginibacter sp.]
MKKLFASLVLFTAINSIAQAPAQDDSWKKIYRSSATKSTTWYIPNWM